MKVLLSKKELSADSIGKKRKKTLHNRRLSTLPLFLLIRDPAVSFVFLPSFLASIDRSMKRGKRENLITTTSFLLLFFVLHSQSSQPLGAVSLLHHTVTRSSFTDRPYGLLLSKGGTIRHWLSAENAQSVDLWLSVFHQASKSAIQVTTFHLI